MPLRLIGTRSRRLAIYGMIFVAVIGLTIALVKLGAMRPGLALPVAAFDVGALGMIIVSSRPAALPLDLRGYGELYNACIGLWSGSLLGPAAGLGERLGLPELVVGFSAMLALILGSAVIHAALFKPEERAALRVRRTPGSG